MHIEHTSLYACTPLCALYFNAHLKIVGSILMTFSQNIQALFGYLASSLLQKKKMKLKKIHVLTYIRAVLHGFPCCFFQGCHINP